VEDKDAEVPKKKRKRAKRIRWRKVRRRKIKIKFNSENFLEQTTVKPLKKQKQITLLWKLKVSYPRKQITGLSLEPFRAPQISFSTYVIILPSARKD
jgi:hypothetical protein